MQRSFPQRGYKSCLSCHSTMQLTPESARPTKSPLDSCSPSYVWAHTAHEATQSSHQSSPEAQAGVAALAEPRAGLGEHCSVPQQGRLSPHSSPAPSPSPAHSDMRVPLQCCVTHWPRSTLLTPLEFVCTWTKLNWKTLWSCLPCWENRQAWNTLITFFCTVFRDLKKWVYTCMKIVASTCSDEKCICVFWLTTQVHYLHLNMYLQAEKAFSIIILNPHVCVTVAQKALPTSTVTEPGHFLALAQQERVAFYNYLTGDEMVRYPIIY